ncbi:hypothetical protein HG536_0C02390 [Torulaspora globosa]|uniref:DASH complex subunit DAM1 n=1 Tax=Torulaspora globosa TaxID=48254 RepID=A0A7G3ZEY4_9SACH|nr:uncharacterized protein HG536_0C02390 [Torulaspora globosa]QLL32070.1 hypothetical protein HG536_0C02390 [Torulaspora globosa]
MSQDKPKISGKRSATEYRLSIASNSGSRRSSLVGINDNGHGSIGGGNRSIAISGTSEEEEDMLKAYILPQVREFTDSLSTLDANFTQLNFIHESLVDFNESLGALLYGLMCNSWCVDFPYVSHDIAGELNVLERLESLAAEKDLLLEQLEQLKNQDKKPSEDNTKNTQFVRPAHPATQIRRPNQRRLIATQRLDDDEEDEVANSEASFVSNPTMEFSRPHQRGVSKSESRHSSRLRRKSILHTIRNSISSTSDAAANQDPNFSTGMQKRSRLSLGGGATRVLTNSSPFKSARTQGNAIRVPSQSRNQTLANARTTSTQESRRQGSATVRPPFR